MNADRAGEGSCK